MPSHVAIVCKCSVLLHLNRYSEERQLPRHVRNMIISKYEKLRELAMRLIFGALRGTHKHCKHSGTFKTLLRDYEISACCGLIRRMRSLFCKVNLLNLSNLDGCLGVDENEPRSSAPSVSCALHRNAPCMPSWCFGLWSGSPESGNSAVPVLDFQTQPGDGR